MKHSLRDMLTIFCIYVISRYSVLIFPMHFFHQSKCKTNSYLSTASCTTSVLANLRILKHICVVQRSDSTKMNDLESMQDVPTTRNSIFQWFRRGTQQYICVYCRENIKLSPLTSAFGAHCFKMLVRISLPLDPFSGHCSSDGYFMRPHPKTFCVTFSVNGWFSIYYCLLRMFLFWYGLLFKVMDLGIISGDYSL